MPVDPQTTVGVGNPDTPASTVPLSWRDARGEALTVYPVTRTDSWTTGPTSTVVIAGHEVSLWDARMIGSYLADLYRALQRE